jgi:foldase protein PrsA
VTRTPRRLALAAGAAALLLLSGCGDSQVRPGAAAIVGDERITTDALEQLVERGLADPQAAQQLGSDREGYQRLALSRLINNEVLEEVAEDEQVTVTEGDVSQQIEKFAAQAGGREALEQQAAQSGIAPQDLPGFVRAIVLDQAIGDKVTADLDVPPADLQALYQENIGQYDQVRSRHILVAQEAQARTILANVQKDRSRFEQLAAQFSTDTSNKDQGGSLGLAGRGQFVPAFENAIFGARPGQVVLVQTQFGWHVVEVLERNTTTLAEATPELRRTALQTERQTRVQELVARATEELGVKVNPRFGRWNPESGQVEPIDGANGVLTPAPGKGGGAPLPGGEQPPVEGEAPQGEQPPVEGEAPQGEQPPVEGEAPPAPQGEAPPTPAG